MGRDRAVFFAVGITFGVVVGLVLGWALFHAEEPVPAAPASVADGSPGIPAADPHAGGGMESVSTRLAALRSALAKNPRDVGALLDLGGLYIQAGMNDRALSAFREAADAGADPSRLAQAAQGLWQSGAPREALVLAQRALGLPPKSPESAVLVAEIALHGVGDLDAADAALAELERRAPGQGSGKDLAKEVAARRELLERAARQPGDYPTQVEAGNFLYDVSRWSEAETAYRRALAIKGGDPNVITDFGVTLLNQGRSREALGWFEKAWAINPRQWQAAFRGAVASIELKDADQGRRWLERLKTAAPENSAAVAQIEQALARLK